MARLTRLERSRAAIRIAEEHSITLAQAGAILDAPAPVVTRWIVQGKAGVHLDAVLDPEKGWITSREAVARFLEAAKMEAG